MSRGKHYEEVGILLREGRDVVLARDGGGQWRLDTHASTEAFLGRRVRVRGMRAEFDLLDVISITSL